MKDDTVWVLNNGMTVKNVPHLKLEIGKGKGCRRAYLSTSEARQIAYALMYQAERVSGQS